LGSVLSGQGLYNPFSRENIVANVVGQIPFAVFDAKYLAGKDKTLVALQERMQNEARNRQNQVVNEVATPPIEPEVPLLPYYGSIDELAQKKASIDSRTDLDAEQKERFKAVLESRYSRGQQQIERRIRTPEEMRSTLFGEPVQRSRGDAQIAASERDLAFQRRLRREEAELEATIREDSTTRIEDETPLGLPYAIRLGFDPQWRAQRYAETLPRLMDLSRQPVDTFEQVVEHVKAVNEIREQVGERPVTDADMSEHYEAYDRSNPGDAGNAEEVTRAVENDITQKIEDQVEIDRGLQAAEDQANQEVRPEEQAETPERPEGYKPVDPQRFEGSIQERIQNTEFNPDVMDAREMGEWGGTNWGPEETRIKNITDKRWADFKLFTKKELRDFGDTGFVHEDALSAAINHVRAVRGEIVDYGAPDQLTRRPGEEVTKSREHNVDILDDVLDKYIELVDGVGKFDSVDPNRVYDGVITNILMRYQIPRKATKEHLAFQKVLADLHRFPEKPRALSRPTQRNPIKPYPITGNKDALVKDPLHRNILRSGLANTKRVFDSFAGSTLLSRMLRSFGYKGEIQENHFHPDGPPVHAKVFKDLQNNPEGFKKRVENIVKDIDPRLSQAEAKAKLQRWYDKDAAATTFFAAQIQAQGRPIFKKSDISPQGRKLKANRNYVFELIDNLAADLQNSKVTSQDGWKTLTKAQAGDLFLLDPPYQGTGARYGVGSIAEQAQLARIDKYVLPAHRKKAKIVYYDKWSDAIAKKLEDNGFVIDRVKRENAVDEEIVAHNYEALQFEGSEAATRLSETQPLQSTLGNLLSRVFFKMGMTREQAAQNTLIGLRIAGIFEGAQELGLGTVTGRARGAASRQAESVWLNFERLVKDNDPILTRSVLGHELFHGWENLGLDGKLPKRAQAIFDKIEGKFDEYSSSDRRVMIEATIDTLPKSMRQQLKDVLLVEDAYATGAETRATIGSLVALSMTLPKSASRFRDFMTFMPDVIHDLVK